MATDSDNTIILSRNFLRDVGGSVTASGTTSGFFVDDVLDGNRDTYWKSSSTSTSDTITFDCGANLPVYCNRFFLHSNLSDFTLSYSNDGSSWSTSLDATGKTAAAALYTVTTSDDARYWRLTASSTQTAGAYRIVYNCGLYRFGYQFSDGENPMFVPSYSEAGQAAPTQDGLIWQPTIRELVAFNLRFDLIRPGTYTSIKAHWRSYRSSMGVYVQPSSDPTELYDMVPSPLTFAHVVKYRGVGRAGDWQFRQGG